MYELPLRININTSITLEPIDDSWQVNAQSTERESKLSGVSKAILRRGHYSSTLKIPLSLTNGQRKMKISVKIGKLIKEGEFRIVQKDDGMIICTASLCFAFNCLGDCFSYVFKLLEFRSTNLVQMN